MKTTFVLLLSILFNAPSVTTAQAPQTLEGVCSAIGAGDIDALVAVMGNELELSILDEEDIYDKATAENKLKGFFAALGSTSFGKVHQGASKAEDAEYCIGTLTSGKGNYRVYVYVAKNGRGVVLQELRFDPS